MGAEKIIAPQFALLDHLPAGAFVIRKDGTVLFWNRCLEDWTGISREQIVGSSILSQYPHLEKPKYRTRLKDVFEGGPPAIFSSQLHKYIIPAVLPDGIRRIQHTTVSPVEAADGSGFHALFIIQDVTGLTKSIDGYREMCTKAIDEIAARQQLDQELRTAHDQMEQRVRDRTNELTTLNRRLRKEIADREQAEQSLRESESRFRSLFDNVSVGMALVDAGGVVRTMNGAFLRFLCRREEEIIGRPFADFIIPADRSRGTKEHLELLEGERAAYVIVKQFDCGGETPGWGRLTVSAIRGQDGALLFTAVVCEDLTERKRIEDELFKVQKLESLGVLAGGIAHDFNNLLTAVLGNASSARRMLDPESVAARRLADAEKASLRARELTRQLLTFSKGGLPIKTTASIGELIRESTAFVLTGAGLHCEFHLPDELWPVDIDEGQINQVLNNILVNAREAMPGGGAIHIRAENAVTGASSSLPLSSGVYVKISIQDEGVGIPQEIIGNLFDPYFTTKAAGTGLGLATSYSIVKNHGGYLTADSEPGKGATFTIYLPASRDKVAERPLPEQPVTGKGRVLLIDDEEIVRAAAGIMLADLGYEAELARDGREAIAVFQRAKNEDRPFDSVIIDLTIAGGMGGKETIRELTRLDPAVKTLVSSGYSNDPVMAEYRKYGFGGVVEKPYTVEELGHALRRLLQPTDTQRTC